MENKEETKMENKEETKMENKEETKDINHEMMGLEENISPFKIYEEKYCNKCEDYRGCLGLIDSMTMMLQDSKPMTGNEGIDNMVKSMGGLTFSARFKMILDCSNLRSYISEIK